MQFLVDEASDVPLSQYHHNQPRMIQTPANRTLWMQWQSILDQSSVYTKTRWSIFAFLIFLFSYRVYSLNGFYIVAYALAIFLLNLFLGFLTPLDESEFQTDVLPISNDGDEFKPFFRRLPEFQFWYACTNATLIALAFTFFSIFNIPVFWPILLFYFIILFFFTMKKQIQHMIRYRYIPFSFGKKTYANNPNSQQFRML